MAKSKKSPPSNGRLGDLILVDKKRLSKELSDSRKDVNTKADVETTMDIFFGQMERRDA